MISNGLHHGWAWERNENKAERYKTGGCSSLYPALLNRGPSLRALLPPLLPWSSHVVQTFLKRTSDHPFAQKTTSRRRASPLNVAGRPTLTFPAGFNFTLAASHLCTCHKSSSLKCPHFLESAHGLVLFPLARIPLPFPANLLPAHSALLQCHRPGRSSLQLAVLLSSDTSRYSVPWKPLVFHLMPNYISSPRQGCLYMVRGRSCFYSYSSSGSKWHSALRTWVRSESNHMKFSPRKSLEGKFSGCADSKLKGWYVEKKVSAHAKFLPMTRIFTLVRLRPIGFCEVMMEKKKKATHKTSLSR